MSGPAIRRDGDVWAFSWDQHGVAIGMDNPSDTRDGIRVEVTVENALFGRVVGPVGLNILSAESQTRFATACAKRVNGLDQKIWHALVVHACAVVVKQWRQPTPTLDLRQVEAAGPTEYVIPLLLPRSETTVLYGDGESGKSLLALRIAYAVAMGSTLPWGDQAGQCEVLYLDWETNPKTVAGRLKRLAEGDGESVPRIHYRQCFRPLTDEVRSVREEISKKDIGLVVVDSIGFALTGALVEDETARAGMNALRQMDPATRLVVAHVSAETARQTTGKASPFGSRFFWNGMRSGIEVRRAEDQPREDTIDLGVYHRKSNDGVHHRPFGLRARFAGPAGPIQFSPGQLDEVPELAMRTPLSVRLRALLRGGARTTAELAEELDTSSGSVRMMAGRMSDVQRLDPGGRGKGHDALWGLKSE